ncbi:putative acyltransferase SID5 [Colletotrichum orbiculare MAFF 240422]|uniref:Acyltransferase SID5 n=1 Tax=Colletotrichum orbiculare (strain 104-T / ATCC 96160 / CBS 514.97 / LARS 414 / MAFF 240422) TaxID=1213857 RepID=N4UX85_COLOR|nr:putative acyltransferase SID5 [Colletotrichum orbiculare MAFF 240422]
MGYAILPALIPDIEKVYDSYFNAFKGDEMGDIMVKILFPGGTGTEEFRKAHTAGTLAWWHQSDCQYTYKCVDTDTGEIVGMALGDIHLRERGREERKNHGVGWLEGRDRERAEAVLSPLHDVREKLFGGRRYIYTHVIAVDPEHQGRKAVLLWCRWGMELSDSLGIPLYFESSPSTCELYEKMGYETLEDRIVHKAELMGTSGDIEVPLMVKMPACAGGMTFKEWRAAGYPPFSEVKRVAALPAVDIVPADSVAGKGRASIEVQVREVQV